MPFFVTHRLPVQRALPLVRFAVITSCAILGMLIPGLAEEPVGAHSCWTERLVPDITSSVDAPIASKATVSLNGEETPPSFGTVAGFWLFAQGDSPQIAMMGHPADRAVITMRSGDRIKLVVSLTKKEKTPPEEISDVEIGAQAASLDPDGGRLKIQLLEVGKDAAKEATLEKKGATLLSQTGPLPEQIEILLEASDKPVVVRLEPFFRIGDKTTPLSLDPVRRPQDQQPVESSPQLQPAIEAALIEWDWRMQGGIDTPRESVTYPEAIEKLLQSGDLLADDLLNKEDLSEKDVAEWRQLRKRYESLKKEKPATDPAWSLLWLEVHQAKRALALKNPLFTDLGPLLFCKRVPSIMSHQLTQYYGYAARPGGGLFVLDKPGQSMQARCLTDSLPDGSYLRPEVSYDGQAIYFPFCEAKDAPKQWRDPTRMDRYYQLYSMKADGSQLQKLTSGNYDHIQPVMLPDGSLICSSTRRGGFHRCGAGPCYVYTLTALGADGSNPHPISFHETNEWDPVVLKDGRVIYTRWDYVDRNAIFYQHLWSVRQDGSDVRIYYGNNTLNPLGIWETRSVPGSHRVMATAAPHHAMTAGSIVLLDTTQGVDGPRPLKRLTPNTLFPETEAPLAHSGSGSRVPRFDEKVTQEWAIQKLSPHRRTESTVEQRRWPGHCYRSPWPLSEDYFLASYSYDRLRGEATANIPNMFGLYLVDVFGNRELLYRDPNISSQWPIPLKSRPVPPETPKVEPACTASGSSLKEPRPMVAGDPKTPVGILALQNVYESWPKKLGDKVTHLRIIQVLPKTTPNIDNPAVGKPFAAPGKQVLGTVPVEEDGSAYFEVPAKTPILFQALDAKGRAIQTMRSLTYLQPGEKLSCVGCHESRTSPPLPISNRMAFAREPSQIKPGPEGSKPFSYPILVQSVLDKHCVECHNPQKPEGNTVLTNEPEGNYTKSYNSLVKHIAYSAWTMPNNNYEPMTEPNRFGARASRLVKLLDEGHYDVKLSPEEWERLVTWIDANGLFYGTFNREDQAKQKQGLKIKGPELE